MEAPAASPDHPGRAPITPVRIAEGLFTGSYPPPGCPRKAWRHLWLNHEGHGAICDALGYHTKCGVNTQLVVEKLHKDITTSVSTPDSTVDFTSCRAFVAHGMSLSLLLGMGKEDCFNAMGCRRRRSRHTVAFALPFAFAFSFAFASALFSRAIFSAA